MTQHVCDWCQAVIPVGKDLNYLEIGKNRSGGQAPVEWGTEVCEDCIAAIRRLKQSRAAGGAKIEARADLQDHRLDQMIEEAEQAQAGYHDSPEHPAARLSAMVVRLVAEVRRNRETLWWAYLGEQDDPATVVGSWLTWHADQDADYIGLIQWHRDPADPWEQRKMGSITFPVALADRVIAAIQHQQAKAEEVSEDDD